jgi:spore coat protein U-like protein
MKFLVLWCALLFCVDGLSSPLRAATCTLNATGINFGNYDPTSGATVTANGSLTFQCTNTGLGDTVILTVSTGSSGTYTNRTMKLGSQNLNYNIYADSGYTSVLGDGTGVSYELYGCYGNGSGSPCPTSGGAPDGTIFSGSMYGQMLGGQDVSAGSYIDTLTVTLTF